MLRVPAPPRVDALAFAHPAVARWFRASFDSATDAQARSWPAIADGRSTLLLAPTGSGKTLAAFLVAINRLMLASPAEGTPTPKTRVLYISPIKALGVDVERNLRAPLRGILESASTLGVPFRELSVGVRSGDTLASERARLGRSPPDILITTPESLYLMLTSEARTTLTHVELVIVDEIHSVCAGKRGAHLALSLERLEAARDSGLPSLQRVGLSATQRPLDEIARFLGGYVVGGSAAGSSVDGRPRAVEIIDASGAKAFELSVETPIEDMARPRSQVVAREGDGREVPSIWPSIHPRLVELILAHRSTMIFVNSRRLAERLALAINELAEREICLAHHGSIAKEKRAEVEDRLKRGTLPAIVATSSLELGIDMGAVDLVIQIEAPPSVASGVQRIGRAGHQVGATSRGILFPKFRGDLLACAAVTRRIQSGAVEATRYPRNPIDVLAQQIVAMVSVEPWHVDELFALVRRAAPFAELTLRSFENVLDMLAGRYPSEQFAGLRARITWERATRLLKPRRSARLVAITNAGTIPDRGLFGVFLAHTERPVRVGELDEEMVFESQAGDVFLLGASSWRIEQITHDRVTVVPAPGQPGRMPFWRGDRPGRPLEFGREIGKLAREISEANDMDAARRLETEHWLDPRAATNLVQYLRDQAAASAVPTDRELVVERFQDEIGDFRVVVLSPFGGRVHAPWTIAVKAKIRESLGLEVDAMWSDDGMVFRIPEADELPDDTWFIPSPEDVEHLVTRELPNTPLFGAHFRQSAARALLLPRRGPGRRTPLWVQRQRSADLLSIATRYEDFPIVLETHRECLRDVFDVPALVELLTAIQTGSLRVRRVDTKTPSPFAASLLFAYVANFLYEGDQPVAERRAQALTLDHAQLRELLGEPELREMLSRDALIGVELELQHLAGQIPLRDADDVHDLLRALGDLDRDEIDARRGTSTLELDVALSDLALARRICSVRILGGERFIAAEDAARYRDALGVVLPPGLPEDFLSPDDRALVELAARYARTHAPFVAAPLAARWGIGVASAELALAALEAEGRLLRGEFTPGGTGREYCEPQVLARIKRRSLSKLRSEVEAVPKEALQRYLLDHQSVTHPLRDLDGVLSVVEQLQGATAPFSVWEREIFPARIRNFSTRDLDDLCAAGEIVWRGVSPGTGQDGKVALYLADDYARLAEPALPVPGTSAEAIRVALGARGAVFFPELARAAEGFPGDLLEVLWDMVWAGEVTNDTLKPLRSRVAPADKGRGSRGRRAAPSFRSRRSTSPGSEGRWSLLPTAGAAQSPTERAKAKVEQLLRRYGVLTREAISAEGITGGFSAVYPVLSAMEAVGKIRRGYFVEGLGATQFALPGAEDRLRSFREPRADERATSSLSAVDPAVLVGVAWPWAATEGRPGRHSGAHVILDAGAVIAFVARGGSSVSCFLPERDPERASVLLRIAEALARLATPDTRFTALVSRIDGEPAEASLLGPALLAVGFRPSARGYLYRGAGAGLR